MEPTATEPEIRQPPRWAVEQAARLMAARGQWRPSDLYREHVAGRPATDAYQYHFHRSTHTVRAMALGNGSGKTTTMAVEVDWWLQHRHPYQATPDWPIQAWWVCLKYGQMEELRGQLEATALTAGWRWNDNKHKYTWPNGSTLTIISNDSDWTTAQGPNPDIICIDEECDRKLYAELQVRRRGRKKTRYVIAATATKGKRWLYEWIYKPWLEHHAAAGLTEDQAMRTQSHPRIWMWPKGGIEDNPIADVDDVDWYEHGVQYASPQEKQVRRRGGFMDLTAAPVFSAAGLDRIDAARIAARLPGRDGELVQLDPAKWKRPHIPQYRFDPTGGTWRGGRITLYEAPTDANYALGADFANGMADGDFDAACVVRRGDDGNAYQVAEAEGRWGSGPMSFVLLALAWHFNQALIVGEANSMGMAALRRLYEELGYSYLYTRRTSEAAKFKHKTDLLGYHKGADSVLVKKLMWAIAPYNTQKGAELAPRFFPRSPRLIEQLRRYQYRPRTETRSMGDVPEGQLIMAAPPGEHDDLVSAAVGAVEGWLESPRFEKPEPQYEPGTAGDVLKHKEVRLAPPKRKQAFTFGKPGKNKR